MTEAELEAEAELETEAELDTTDDETSTAELEEAWTELLMEVT